MEWKTTHLQDISPTILAAWKVQDTLDEERTRADANLTRHYFTHSCRCGDADSNAYDEALHRCAPEFTEMFPKNAFTDDPSHGTNEELEKVHPFLDWKSLATATCVCNRTTQSTFSNASETETARSHLPPCFLVAVDDEGGGRVDAATVGARSNTLSGAGDGRGVRAKLEPDLNKQGAANGSDMANFSQSDEASDTRTSRNSSRSLKHDAASGNVNIGNLSQNDEASGRETSENGHHPGAGFTSDLGKQGAHDLGTIRQSDKASDGHKTSENHLSVPSANSKVGMSEKLGSESGAREEGDRQAQIPQDRPATEQIDWMMDDEQAETITSSQWSPESIESTSVLAVSTIGFFGLLVLRHLIKRR